MLNNNQTTSENKSLNKMFHLNRLDNKYTRALFWFLMTLMTISMTHLCLINIYTKYCIPQSFFGVIGHLINMGSPVCMLINTVQFELSKYWVIIVASATTSTIAFIMTQGKQDNNK